ncbi:hypothetical protein Fcan01_18991 [Folsomia candida]|uniref:Uncharacterized protein n=1 Tax=Folsomia candida TaxID=158441 RepID=A0A226DM25_FOLCA|nr:hypothetical protein Fcan01_18991 [Folsomia candida]
MKYHMPGFFKIKFDADDHTPWGAKLVGDLLSNKPDFTEDILVIIPPKGKKSVGVDQLLSLTKRSPPQCLDLHRLGIYARLHGLPTELKSPLLKKFRDKDSSKHEKLVLAQILKYCAKKESTEPFLSTTEVSNLLQSLETTNSTPTINDDPYDPDLFFNLGTSQSRCGLKKGSIVSTNNIGDREPLTPLFDDYYRDYDNEHYGPIQIITFIITQIVDRTRVAAGNGSGTRYPHTRTILAGTRYLRVARTTRTGNG